MDIDGTYKGKNICFLVGPYIVEGTILSAASGSPEISLKGVKVSGGSQIRNFGEAKITLTNISVALLEEETPELPGKASFD